MLLKRNFIVLALLFAWFGHDGKAQESQPVSTPQPNCKLVVNLSATAGAISGPLDNRQVGCLNFTFTSAIPTTISALNLVVETAQSDGSMNCSSCTWATFTAATGSNPTTSTAGSNATFTTPVGNTYYDYLRVRLVSVSGTGVIQGKLFSSIISSGGGGGGGSGCVGTVGTPCIVAGPDNTGAAPTQAPVQVAGVDNNGNILPLQMDASFFAQIVEPINGANPFLVSEQLETASGQLVFNYACLDTNAITIAGAGNTLLISGSPGLIPHICGFSFSFSAPSTTFQLVEGQTSSTPCDTSAVPITGPMAQVQSNTYIPGFINGPVAKAHTGDDVCLAITGSVTGGGFITYALLNF